MNNNEIQQLKDDIFAKIWPQKAPIQCDIQELKEYIKDHYIIVKQYSRKT